MNDELNRWLLDVLENRAKAYKATARHLRMDAESAPKHTTDHPPLEDCDSPEQADSIANQRADSR